MTDNPITFFMLIRRRMSDKQLLKLKAMLEEEIERRSTNDKQAEVH